MKKYPENISKKIVTLDGLIKKLSKIRKNKKIALCHGTFDIVHPGHIRHLTYSKQKSDILVTSVTSDKHVVKTKEGPYVPERLRVLNLASLEIVDYVVIDYNFKPISLLSKLKPDYFMKGFEYSSNNIHPKTREEIRILNKYGGEILFSPGDIVYSSTFLKKINKPKIHFEKLALLMNSENVSFKDLENSIKKFSKVKIHLIGDVIVDKYIFCSVLGQTTKTPTLSVKKNTEEQYIGGAGIVAKHLKKCGSDVSFTTIIGNDKLGDFVKQDLKKNKISFNCIVDKSRNTTLKERFWADKHKLLQVDVVDNHVISDKIENQIKKRIFKTKADAVIFSDFRHGIFNNNSVKNFCKNLNKKTLKVADSQVSNRWGNILDFKNFDLILPNEKEARFSLADQDTAVRQLGTKLYRESKSQYLILKLGEKGVLTFRGGGENPRDFFPIDSFVEELVDGVGAGDALLAASTLSLITSKNILISSIIGSIAASLVCELHGNQTIDLNLLKKRLFEIKKHLS